jgi:hypothetical protein
MSRARPDADLQRFLERRSGPERRSMVVWAVIARNAFCGDRHLAEAALWTASEGWLLASRGPRTIHPISWPETARTLDVVATGERQPSEPSPRNSFSRRIGKVCAIGDRNRPGLEYDPGSGVLIQMLDETDKTLLRFAGIPPGLTANDEPNRKRLARLAELGLVEIVPRESASPGGLPMPPLYRTTERGRNFLK